MARSLSPMSAAGVVATLLFFVSLAAFAQSVELLPVETMTVTKQQFLTGSTDGKPVIIAGELRIPKPGPEKVAAVIVMEGAGGITPMIGKWGETINSIGVASFVLDSFSGRGISD